MGDTGKLLGVGGMLPRLVGTVRETTAANVSGTGTDGLARYFAVDSAATD